MGDGRCRLSGVRSNAHRLPRAVLLRGNSGEGVLAPRAVDWECANDTGRSIGAREELRGNPLDSGIQAPSGGGLGRAATRGYAHTGRLLDVENPTRRVLDGVFQHGRPLGALFVDDHCRGQGHWGGRVRRLRQ